MADKNKPDNHDDEEIIPFKEEGSIEIPDPEGETQIQPIERVEEIDKEQDSFEDFDMPGGPESATPQEEEISTDLGNDEPNFEGDVLDSDVMKSLEEPSRAPKTQFAGSMEEEIHGSEESPVEEEVEVDETDTASSPDPELPEVESKKTQLASSQPKHTMFQREGEIEETPAEESGLLDEGEDQGVAGTDQVDPIPFKEGDEIDQVSKEDEPGINTNTEQIPPSDEKPSEGNEESSVAEEVEVEAQGATGEMETSDYPSQKPVKGPSRFVWSMVGLFLGALIPTGLYLGGIEIPQKYRFVEGPEFGDLKTKYSKAEQSIKDKDGKISELDKQIADNKVKHDEEIKLAVAVKQKELDDLQKSFDLAKAQHKKELEQKDILIAKEKEDGDKRVAKAMDEGKKNLADATTKYEKEKKDLMASFKKQEDDYIAKIDVLNGVVKRVEAERDKSNNLIKSVGGLLVNAKVHPPLSKNPSDPKEVYEGVKEAIVYVEMKDPGGVMRRLKEENEILRGKNRTQGQILELATLPRPNGPSATKETREKGIEIANKVLANKDSSQGDKGRAEIYLGEEQLAKKEYASAKDLLQKGKTPVGPSDKDWSFRAEEGLKIATDPVGHYLSLTKGKGLITHINYLNDAEDAARKVAPERVYDVLVLRANVFLEAAQRKGVGTAPLGDINRGNSIKDANEAVKGGKANAFLIKFKVEVDLAIAYRKVGQKDKEEESKKAAKDFANKAIAADASLKGEIGLDWKILGFGNLEVSGLMPIETGYQAAGLEGVLVQIATSFYFQPQVSAAQPDEIKQDKKTQEEILELINNGQHAKALELFIIHFRRKMEANDIKDEPTILNVKWLNLLGLLKIINPNLSSTDFAGPRTPEFAEQCFGEGVNLFFNRKYEEAEKALNHAIQAKSDDARYHYFLALSMHAQGKITAADSFGRAANLERNGRPNRSVVSTSLERVQGSIRTELNKYRNAGLAPRP